MTDHFIALFTYGGGIRGLVPACIMEHIEERTGLPMAHMVDIFSGPSSGAILNAGLNTPHPKDPNTPIYKAAHMVKFYERNGRRIFPSDRFRDFRGIVHDFNNRTLRLEQLNHIFRHGHYDSTNLAKAMRAMYGQTPLSQSISSLIISTYNIDGEQLRVAKEPGESDLAPAHTKNNFIDEGGRALWLKNIKTGYPDHQHARTPDISLYDAVMASAAAPTYFPCHHFTMKHPDYADLREISAIDGVIFDNPCISYLGAIRRHVPPGAQLSMICLGTGSTNKSVTKDDWNSYGSLGVVDPVNDLPLINIFFHASESALIQSFEEELGDNLYLFNKSMLPRPGGPVMPNSQIDDTTPENIERLKNFAQALMEEQSDKLDTVCDLLVRNYERKKKRKKGVLSFLSGE